MQRWGWAAGRSPGKYGLEAEQAQESLSPLPIDANVFPDLPRAKERPLDIQAVDLPHQGEVLGRLPERLVVAAAASQADQLTLTRHAQVLVVRIDALPLDLSRPQQLFFNHSPSIFSRPIYSKSSCSPVASSARRCRPSANSSATWAMRCFFHAVTWLVLIAN